MNAPAGPPVQTDQRPPLPHPALYDETTRLLSAAAHLDADFCNAAIGEFLTDPLRAVAPSPGMNEAAVLREAVSARSRRRWRDGVLAVLVVTVGVLSTALLGSWLITAVWWSTVGPRRRNLDGMTRPRPSIRAMLTALFAGLFIAAIGAATWLYQQTTSSAPDSGTFGGFGDPGGGAGAPTNDGLGVRGWIALGLTLLVVAILVVDRLRVWSLLTTSFRRGRFTATPQPAERLRTMGSSAAAARLLRQRSAAQRGNLVVYLDDKPFVGWGEPLSTWSIAIPLEPAEQGLHNGAGRRGPKRLPAAFPLLDLYDHIGAYLGGLRRSLPALSPSFRLRGLEEFETLFVPAGDLVTNYGTPPANLVLPRLDRPPVPGVDPRYTKQVAEQPLEWLRYYRCFQVETWDRDLVVSLFLHVGADQDMLYFECTPCVLAPIDDAYRAIDRLSPRSRLAPVLDAIGSALVLPMSIFTRLGRAFRSAGAVRDAADNDYSADRYGTRFSLRELAAQNTLTDYLKVRDVDRYLMLMQDRVFEATYEFLDARGISSKVFREKANIIQNNAYNNFDQRNSNFNGSMFGTINQNSAPAAPAPA